MITQRTHVTLVALTALTCLSSSALAKATGAVSVERIETRGREAAREVVIHTSKDPTFSVFRLSDPFRVLVDINDATLPSAIDLMKVNDGVLRYVSTNTFADETSSIVRVEIALEQNAEYRVRGEGSSIVVKIDLPKRGAVAADTKTVADAQPASTPVTEKVEPAVEKTAAVRLGSLSKRAEKERTVLTAKVEAGTLAKGAIKIEHIEGPSRLVVDIAGAELSPKYQKLALNKLGVKQVRTGPSDEGAKIVLDLAENKPLPRVDVDSVDGKLEIVLSKAEVKAEPVVAAVEKTEPAKVEETKVEPAKVEVAKVEKVEPAKVETAKVETANVELAQKIEPAKVEAKVEPAKVEKTAHVTDVRFEPRDGFVRLTVVLDGDAASVEKAKAGDVPFLRVKHTDLPQALERTLDVSEVAGDTVSAISTYKDGTDTIISANVGQGTEHRHWQKGNKLMWDFRTTMASADARLTSSTTPKQDARVLAYPEQAAAGYSAQALQIGSSITPAAEKYKGRRISLDLKDADILNVLRLLADVSKLNIVASDDVKGRVTIKLRNVPWDQALDIILRSKQLDKTRSGNIIRIAPVDVLRKEEELRVERQKTKIDLEPLAVRLIPVSYAVANDVKPQVQALLSSRGKVNIDTRTNVLVVEDIPEVLLKVERLVRTLDTQTPQVLIEARIVEANTSFARQLGIQWGGSVSATQQYGTSTGLAFPNNIRIAGGADDPNGNATSGLATPTNYAVNLPAAIGSGAGGGLGFMFGSAGGSALLQLRLTAAETSGKVKIISAPKIVTLDNKEAHILAGEKVPITVITANGPSTRFIDANLELGVTPHVTQDGSVLLNVNAKRNTLSDRRDLLGTPGILAREAQTEMLVRDGDTAVLGGIYQRTARDVKSYVPWIGQIPVIGWIFKTTQKSDDRQELLIFISPRIVNRAQALVSVQ